MSADSWERCPICHNRPDEYPEGIDHLYGKIPLEEFLELKDKLDALEEEETVREDYEVYLSDEGYACVAIYMKCQTCGAEWSFNKMDIHMEGSK